MGSIFFSFLKMLVFIVSDSNVRESLSIAKQDNTWEFVMRCVRLQRMRPSHIAFIRSLSLKKLCDLKASTRSSDSRLSFSISRRISESSRANCS
jgi:hypothetical protein